MTDGHGTLSKIEEEILRAVRAIRYGSVEILVHDSRVVQIERREKVRLEARPRKPGEPGPENQS